MTILAHVVEPGWVSAHVASNLAGDDYRILTYADGTRRFEHRCDRGPRGVIICAPKLDERHQVVRLQPLTVVPSILCPDCGTHGFVRDGRWVPA